MSIVERARELRKTIESLAEAMDDSTAMDNAELFPHFDPNSHSYNVGDRVCKDGVLYKVLQAHTSQPGWAPENAHSLFAEILAGQEGTAIGEWVQPDSTNPYSKGERVMLGGKVYESLIDGNVWSPAAYPAGWQEVL